MHRPLLFRNQSYQVKKKFLEGTHRLISPQETYQKVKAYEKNIGLTRNANITGLDRLGVPVTLAIRPNSLTLATSSGKGLSLDAALVSGVMEALELHHVEIASFQPLFLSYEELIKDHAHIPLEDLPFRKFSLFHPKWPERWVFGWDLLSSQEVAVPYTSVSMNYRAHAIEPTELRAFSCGTNGLAAGNHFLEALVSGLCELIERDAISCHEVAKREKSFRSPRINAESIPFSIVQNLLDKFKEVEVVPFIYDCTVDTQVPVFKAVLYDKKHPYLGFIAGYGAHLDSEVAMIRALTEAAQGHTGLISGARDDLFSSRLAIFRQRNLNRDLDYYLSQKTSTVTYVNRASSSFEEDAHLLIDNLKKAGLKQIIVFDLTQPEFDISVIRVMVPGLEEYYGEIYTPGRRAKDFSLKQKRKEEPSFTSPFFHQPAGRGL